MAAEIPPGTLAPSERPCDRHEKVVDFSGRQVASGPCAREGRRVQHTAYVAPTVRRSWLAASIVAAAVLTATLPTLFFFGAPTGVADGGPRLRLALSPSPTSSPHSLATFDCAQCHAQTRSTEASRCERCHDASISGRLSGAAHAFPTSGDVRQALAAPSPDCTRCHVEHRGTGVRLREVDDRECGSCHRVDGREGAGLTSLARHPEFALVTAAAELGSGLRWFDHSVHLKKVVDKYGRDCQVCHERESRAPEFKRISFAQHCSDCHAGDLAGKTAASLTEATLQALPVLPAGIRLKPDPDDPSRSLVTGISHADPWLLRTVQGLRASADPAGFAAERTVLDRHVAQIELIQRYARPPDVLGDWSTVAVSRAAAPAGATADALARVAAALQQFAADARRALPASAHDAELLEADARRFLAAPPAAPAPPDAVPGTDGLLRIAEATIARARAAGDQSLVERATALRARLGAAAKASGGTPAGALAAGVDARIGLLARIATPGMRAELDEVRSLSVLALKQLSGGVDPTAFDLHRKQTLQLLDTIGVALRKGAYDPSAAARAGGVLAQALALRRRVLANHYDMPDDAAALLDEFFGSRYGDRARVDAELTRAGIRTPPAPERPAAADDQSAPRLEQLRRRLDAMGRPAALRAELRPAEARQAITALIGEEENDPSANKSGVNRCTLCHELSAGGDQLAPVRAVGGSLLARARFTHEPHVSAGTQNCTTVCHASILQSTAARDVNVPGIASCRTCHAAGQQAARSTGCVACHTYHVPSSVALLLKP